MCSYQCLRRTMPRIVQQSPDIALSWTASVDRRIPVGASERTTPDCAPKRGDVRDLRVGSEVVNFAREQDGRWLTSLNAMTASMSWPMTATILVPERSDGGGMSVARERRFVQRPPDFARPDIGANGGAILGRGVVASAQTRAAPNDRTPLPVVRRQRAAQTRFLSNAGSSSGAPLPTTGAARQLY
jgi:hypothetical protein